MKKRIGISGSIITTGDSDPVFASYERAYVNDDYISAVEKSGALPLILPIVDDEENIRDLVLSCDGIILSGGYDVDPSYWGEEISPKLERIFPRRDAFELKLIQYAREYQKPILGICRGHQILNVAFGGSLYQDLSFAPNLEKRIQHVQTAKYFEATHSIQMEEESFLYSIFGKSTRVNSYHHLAVKELGKDLKVTAISSDGIVEGIEYTGENNFIVGLQFHPEMMHRHHEKALEIFKEFIKKC